MPLTINGVTHNDGDPLTIDGIQASEVTVNGVTVWQDRVLIVMAQLTAATTIRDYINANNPEGATSILLTNAFVQPTIDSGDLTGLDVVFETSGDIQGTDTGYSAMEVTSAFTLINTGTISGAGGWGGTGADGADGADDTYPEDHVDSQYAQQIYEWRYRCPDYPTANVWWDSVQEDVDTSDCSALGPVTISGKQIYRGEFVIDYWGGVYRAEHRWTTDEPRTGGAGGAGGGGGSGAHWSNVAPVAGTVGGAGGASSPSGGNSGATGFTGGAGGDWGVDGSDGEGGGIGGHPHGIGIIGVALLNPDSVIGTVVGGTT